ncbi:MAG: lipocalin-like domain-containing protein [Paracoccaceae bacterium]
MQALSTRRLWPWFTLLAAALLAVAGAWVFMRSPEPPRERGDAGSEAQILESLIDAAAEASFARPSGAWQPALPRDHGAHPEARSETWSLSAHLRGPDGAPIGLEIVFTRFGLRPPQAADDSPWAVDALYRAHAILVRADAPPISEERFARSGTAAAGFANGAPEIWLDDWAIRADENAALQVFGSVDGREFRLTLAPGAQPVPVGESDGVGEAREADTPVRGYALPRLAVTGQIAGIPVTGEAWHDHLWGELPLPGGPVAYDRLILHLDDGTALTLLRTRRRDGRGGASVDGLQVGPDGETEALSGGAVEMTPSAEWRPDGTDTRYPVRWEVAGGGLVLDVSPLIDDQRHAFAAPLWSGLVAVDGTRGGRPVRGLGTLQLTGYDAP